MSDPTTRPTSLPFSPAASEPAAPVIYRPLSLLAVVGLGLAGAYAVVVVLGGLFTYFHSEPLLLGWWSLVPVFSVAISLVALLRIQRSEGTLAGEKAARWGLLLSVLVGFSYWAYFVVLYLAIAGQAKKTGNEFLDKLAKGDDLSAFRLTLPPGERPHEDDRLRAQLEGRFNNIDQQGHKGPLSRFRQSMTVRMLTLGGAATTREFQGVDEWKYVPGGYQVRLLYRVFLPQATSIIAMTLVGKEEKRSEVRQWHVVPDKTGPLQDDLPRITAEGRKMLAASNGAHDYLVKDWLKAAREGRVDDLFLGTLPVAERAPARKAVTDVRLSLQLSDGVGMGALPCAAPGVALSRVGLIGDLDFVHTAALPGLEGFLRGDLVRAEDGVFWAPDDVREDLLKAVRESFRRPNAQLASALTPEGSADFPLVRQQGDRLVVGLDVALPVPLDSPRYLVDGRIVLDCDAAEAEAAAGAVKTWRVRSLDLVSGKSLPAGGMMRPDRMRPGM